MGRILDGLNRNWKVKGAPGMGNNKFLEDIMESRYVIISLLVTISVPSYGAGAKDAKKKTIATRSLVMEVVVTPKDEIPTYSSAFPNSGMPQANPEGEARAGVGLAGGVIAGAGALQAHKMST